MSNRTAAWRRIVEGSRLLGGLRRAIAGSRVVAGLWGLNTALAEWSQRTGIAGTWRRWLEAAWVYRWLTRGPAGRPAVVDLRSSYTVGPVVRLLQTMATSHPGQRLVGALRAGRHRLVAATERAPVSVVSVLAVLTLAASLVVGVAGGSPNRASVGTKLVLLAVALLGTRVRGQPFGWLRKWIEPPDSNANDGQNDCQQDDDP